MNIAVVNDNKKERATGFEPATPGLGSQCSTTEPRALERILL